MTIQFSQQEIDLIRWYVNKVKSGETPTRLRGLDQAFPEWNTDFLLLRKLLAYGVHHVVQNDLEISYQALQKKKPKGQRYAVNYPCTR